MSYYVLPPPVKSLISKSIAKSFNEDDFVVINGRVMLPHEIVAKFFEIPLNDIIPAIHYAKQTDLWASVVLELHGRYYFPTPESVIAMFRISKYREAQVDNTFFSRAFEEVRKDILVDRIGFQVQSPYDADVNNFISKDEFSVVNGKTVLSQEAAARYFGMTVDDLRRAVSTAEDSDPFAQEIIQDWGKYYFPSAEVVFVLKPFSRYRNSDVTPVSLEPAFNTMRFELGNRRVEPSNKRVEPSTGDKVYYEKSAVSPNNKSPKPSTVIWLLFFFAMCIASCANVIPKSSTPPPPPSTTVETQQPKEEPKVETKVETQPTPAPAAKPSAPVQSNYRYKGRGGDAWPPGYTGIQGYAVVATDEKFEMLEDFLYLQTPWQVNTYERDKQFWTRSEQTLEHKTPIIVREEILERYDRMPGYHGYLKVERLSDGEQFYIKVKNLVFSPYWDSLDKALETYSGGCVLAEYHQRSGYWPVDTSKRKKVPEEGSLFIVTEKDYWNSTNPVGAFSSEYGAVLFNKADLTIIY